MIIIKICDEDNNNNKKTILTIPGLFRGGVLWHVHMPPCASV